MKKIVFMFMLVGITALSTSLSLASPAEQSGGGKNGKVFNLPEKVLENPNVPFVKIGEAIDPSSGEMVEGYAIIKYKDKNVKPDSSTKPAKPSVASTCYAFLGSGVKWRSVENWVVNPGQRNASTTFMLSDDFIFNALSGGIAKWENAGSYDILGSGEVTSTILEADTIAPDNKNEVYFADISESGVIGVTIIWGVFGGAPAGRKIVEWDQVYDDKDFAWASDGNPYMMDFESIATHELGHSMGMGDLYTSACIAETMYGYAGEGEINKRDLGAGDITGIRKLY